VTLWEVFAALRRRWVVAVVGLLVTISAGLYVKQVPGVYHQQVDVVFMWPAVPENQSENTFQYGTASLIKTAGVIARVVSDRSAGAQTTSDTATLVGQGVTHGYSVRLPNSGGQWAYDFEHPLLSVESVGTSPAEVRATTAAAVARINAELARIQREEGVAPGLMVRTRLSPPTPVMSYGTGSRVRALAVSQLLGFGLTVTLVVGVDRAARRRAEIRAARARARGGQRSRPSMTHASV
jgi:hypothetical protein